MDMSLDGEWFLERHALCCAVPTTKAPHHCSSDSSDWGLQSQQSALWVMQNPQTDQVRRGPPIVLVWLPPQHLAQDTWEGESMRPLHRGHYITPPSSDPGDAHSSEMPAGRGRTRQIIFLWIKADFQRTRSMKIRTLTPKMTRTPWPHFTLASWNLFLN